MIFLQGEGLAVLASTKLVVFIGKEMSETSYLIVPAPFWTLKQKKKKLGKLKQKEGKGEGKESRKLPARNVGKKKILIGFSTIYQSFDR